ncbi:uncharacterized protein LOC123709514 [Pieris brassicae]|uniref:uncharacterized protein LOC123709514 n=1 Tax=Pieris brassicae TaxID=7116 RepID=UPI001E65F76C|nr:uncharacterized protein LOC123709514 [Pieris brassicae]
MVIAQLEKQDIQNIADLICSPPEADYYNTIKDRLISLYEESNSAQTKKLLSQVELGDQKPSQLMRQMKQLNKDKFPESTIKMMLLEHLPPHIRSVLAVSEAFKIKTTLDDLTLLADKMMEVHTPSQHIAAVATPFTPVASPPIPEQPTIDTLIGEIRRLSLEVAELRVQPRDNYRNSRSRHHLQSRSRNASTKRNENRRESQMEDRSRKKSPMPYCYYHHRYGMDAKKCAPPCSFKPINQSEN